MRSCGCCEGIDRLTPVTIVNRPGLDRLSYRVGTHGRFLATMLTGLSSHSLPGSGRRPLGRLTARAGDDPAIAMLDAWATVADVLTFYQERIANEGYLRTATERRSLLELARLVGYRLRPGVAASVLLAYTLDRDATVTIAKASRAQSVPGPGELPQTFETAEDLGARASWNLLRPQQTRPTPIDSSSVLTLDRVYLAGIATGLRPNDRLVAVFGDDPGAQEVLRVVSVTPQPAEDRTEVALLPSATAGFLALVEELARRLEAHRELDRVGLAGGRRAERIDTELLAPLQRVVSPRFPPDRLLEGLQASLSRLRPELEDIRRRGFVRLTTWLEGVVGDLEPAVAAAVAAGGAAAGAGGPPGASPAAVAAAPGDAVLGLGPLLGPLARPPSLLPAHPTDLDRSAEELFALGSDLGPQLLVTLNPKLAPTLYAAWADAQVAEPSPLQSLQALRVRAAPFGATAPRKPVLNDSGVAVDTEEWPLEGATRVTVAVRVTYSFAGTDPVPETAEVEIRTAGTAAQGNVTLDGTPKDVTLPTGGVHVVDSRAAGQAPSLTFQFSGAATRTITVVGPPPIVITVATGDGPIAVTLDADPSDTWSPGIGRALRGATDGRRFTVALGRGAGGGVWFGQLSVTDDGFAAPQERHVLPLDAVYDGIVPQSWVVVERTGADPPLVIRATRVDTVAKAAYGISAKVTQLTLADPWLTDNDVLLSSVRDTVVHAQAEKVEVAREPWTDDVAGGEIPLDALYDGLQSGRTLVVSGERTDVADATGVRASEPVMLAGVVQHAAPGDTVRTTILLAEPLAYTYKRETVEIRGNVARATHGETGAEVLGSGDGGASMQAFTLHRKPLTYLAAPTPLGVDSTLEVRVDEVAWHEADSLVWLGPTDHGYVTRADDADRTTVTFGNGVNGARLPTGVENVRATYRTGIGRPGNVGADRITQLQTRPLGVSGVTNPLPASGGADRDGLDQARRNAPLAVLALDRLVSVSDYEDFANARAGIGKASALKLSDGIRTLVHLTIAGTDDLAIEPSSDLFRNLRLALQRFGDPAQPVRVAVRELALLVVAASVRVETDRRWELVEPHVRAALLDRFGYDRRDLGQDVVLGEVISAVQAVPGVAWATVDALATVPEGITPADLAALAGTLSQAPPPRIPMALARPQPDSKEPPRTLLPAQLAVLSPRVPDTLILKEIKQ
jgi:predicted phage baseplate assembly protein